MHVLAIVAENIKRLKLVRLDPDGAHVRVAGAPGQGKTTLISLVWAAITKSGIGSNPVTRGQEEGFIEVQLGEPGARAFTVRREYAADGTDKIKVKAEGNGPKVSARDITALLEAITFDPLQFYALRGKDQTDQALALAGVDTVAIDSERGDLFNKRTEQGRDVEKLRGACANRPAKAERVDTAKLIVKSGTMQEENRLRAGEALTLSRLKDQKAKAEAEAARIEESLRQIHDGIDIAESNLAKLTEHDLAPVTEAIRTAEETNRAASAWETYQTKAAELATAESSHAATDAKIKELDQLKRELLASASWPVPGLSVSGDEVTLDGIPLAQCGESKKLQVSFALAAARHPKLRICRVDGAESLGASGRAEILRLAEAHGMQVFMARVADAGAEDGEITIEDGVAVQ